MTSDKQTAANRRNAKLSTGPRTPEGKAVSSLNAAKHAILARETIITSGPAAENPEEFEALLAGLREDCSPVGAREEMLVQQIAVCYWRLRRAIRADTVQFSRIPVAAEGSKEVEFLGVSFPVQSRALPDSTSINNLTRYERSLQRELYRAAEHLAFLQRLRSRKD